MAETEWTRRVKKITNEILRGVDQSEHHEPINWAKLSCVRVERRPARLSNGMVTDVYVEEVSPGAVGFQGWLEARLSDRLGNMNNDKFLVTTEW